MLSFLPRASLGEHRRSGPRSWTIGTEVSATVLSYDPADEDKLELYLTINDGPYKGKKGWMLSFLEETDDGQIMNQFDKAVIENKPRW
jgi:hypothetical protein